MPSTFKLLSISTDVPAPVTLRDPILNAPSVPLNTSELLVALVKNWNCCVYLSKPKKPILAEPS